MLILMRRSLVADVLLRTIEILYFHCTKRFISEDHAGWQKLRRVDSKIRHEPQVTSSPGQK